MDQYNYKQGIYKCIYTHGVFIRDGPSNVAESVGEMDQGDLAELTGVVSPTPEDSTVFYAQIAATANRQSGWVRLNKGSELLFASYEKSPVEHDTQKTSATESVLAPSIQDVAVPEARPEATSIQSTPEAVPAVQSGDTSQKKRTSFGGMLSGLFKGSKGSSKGGEASKQSPESPATSATSSTAPATTTTPVVATPTTPTVATPTPPAVATTPRFEPPKAKGVALQNSTSFPSTAALSEDTTNEAKRLVAENRRLEELLRDAHEKIRTVNAHFDATQNWEQEKTILLAEHRREVNTLIFENRELKRIASADGNESRVRMVQEDIMGLHREKALREKEISDLEKRVENLTATLHDAKSKNEALFNAQEVQKQAWKEREAMYISRLEQVNEYGGHFPLPARPDKSSASGHERPKPRTRSLSPTRNRPSNDEAVSELLRQAQMYHEEQRQQKLRARNLRFRKLNKNDPTTSIIIKVESDTCVESPVTAPLLCEHVQSPGSPTEVTIQDNPSARPNPHNTLFTQSFFPKTFTKKDIEEEKIAKLRDTVVFTGKDLNIRVSNQDLKKEDHHHGAYSKDELTTRHKTSRLGHFASYTTAAAAKSRDIPKCALSNPKGTKNSFRFTGKDDISRLF